MDINAEFKKAKNVAEDVKEKAKEKVNERISEEDMMKLLDACYDKCLKGIGKTIPSVDRMASD